MKRHAGTLALVLPLMAGCDDGVAPVPAGLEMEVQVSPAEIRVGDTATIEMRYWNPSEEAVTVPSVEAGGCGFGIELDGATGRVKYPAKDRVEAPGHACILVPRDVTLDPGEERAWTWEFTGHERRFDEESSEESPSGREVPLSPGEYQVYGAIYTSNGVRRAWDAPGTVRIREADS